MKRIPLSAASTLVALLLMVACSDSNRPSGSGASAFDPFAAGSASAAAGPASPPEALTVGDCFNSDEFSPTSSIDPHGLHLVSCDDLHQHEVYAVEGNSDPSGAPFPGDEAMRSYADDVCLAAFEPALGVAYLQSSLDFATIKPDAESWKAGDREVICAVHDVEFNELQGTQLTTTTTSPAVSSSTSTSLAPKSG